MKIKVRDHSTFTKGLHSPFVGSLRGKVVDYQGASGWHCGGYILKGIFLWDDKGGELVLNTTSKENKITVGPQDGKGYYPVEIPDNIIRKHGGTI